MLGGRGGDFEGGGMGDRAPGGGGPGYGGGGPSYDDAPGGFGDDDDIPF